MDNKDIERGRENLAIPVEWLLNLLRATQGYQTRHELIIPDDAQITSVAFKEDQDCIILGLSSQAYKSRKDFELISTVTYGGKAKR